MAHYQYVKLTTGPQGTQGTQGFRGPSSWTPQFTGGVGYGANSNTFYKTSGIDLDWTAQVSSVEGYIRGCYMSFQATSNTGYLLMGLNSDPTVNSSFTSLDYVFYLASGGILIYESNSPVGSFGTYTTDTVFSITYDGYNIRYWVSEPSIPSTVLVRTTARPIGSPLYLDSSFYHVSNTIGVTNVVFGPMGEQGTQGPQGSSAVFSGTAGTLPKFTGTGTTIGDSIVVESGGRIGIGITPSSAKFEISAGTLGGTLGNYVASQSIFASNSNNDIFEMGSLRTATGADWQSAGFRMQQKIDATWMGYIQFNGSGNDYGITFGTGSSTVSRQSIPERMRISSTGVIIIPGDLGVGTTVPTAKIHAKSTGAVTSPITIFNDNFARTLLSPGGGPTAVTYTATNGAIIEAIGANPVALSLPRSSVYQYATAITPAFPTNNYNPVLNVNTGVLHWSVNTRQSNSSVPTGFAAGQFGQAVILACNTVNPALSTAFGYALTYGNLGTNQWSLVRFQNGLNSNSNITTLVSTTNVGGSNTCFYSIKVTYTPATNSWSLYVRIDGCSGAATVWGNPTTTTTLIGTVVNSIYTASSLPYFGFVYNSTITGNSHFSNYSLINAGTTTYPDSVKVEDGNFKQLNGFAVLENLATLDAATDSVAAGLNVPLYGVYRTGNVLRVRTSSNVDGIVFTTGAQSIDGAKTFLQNVTAPGFFNSSDARLKDVIDRDGDTVKFTWKDGRDSKIHIGYIAQEVQELYPDQVTKGDDGMLTVNYIEVLVAKIQELENRIKQLEK